MLALPTQIVVADTPPIIQKKGQFQFPLLAHSRHNGILPILCMVSGRFLTKTPPWSGAKIPEGLLTGQTIPLPDCCVSVSLFVSVRRFTPMSFLPQFLCGVLLPLARSYRSGFLHVPADSLCGASPGSISHQDGHSIGIIHR